MGQCSRFLICVHTERIYTFHTKESTFAGDMTVMASETSFLAARLRLICVSCDPFCISNVPIICLGHHSRSVHCGEEKSILLLPGFEPRFLSRPGRSTSLDQLSYPGSVRRHIIKTIIFINYRIMSDSVM
jgi:hypothetical protein